MFPRWLWLNHVPAGLDLTPDQYAEVSRRVRAMGSGQRRFTPLSRRILVLMAPLVIALTIAFFIWIIWLTRSHQRGAWTPLLHVAGVLLFQALLWIIIAWSVNRAMAPLVWRALNQIGVRVCEGCGYILDYLPSDAAACPECGATLHPHLAAAQDTAGAAPGMMESSDRESRP